MFASWGSPSGFFSLHPMTLLYALWFPTAPSPPFVSLNGFLLSAAYFLVSCWFSFLFFQVSFPMRCLWELYARSGHCRWHCGWGRGQNLWPDGQGGCSHLHVVLAVQALKCMQWPLVPALQRVISPWAPFVGLTHTIELASISCSSMGA